MRSACSRAPPLGLHWSSGGFALSKIHKSLMKCSRNARPVSRPSDVYVKTHLLTSFCSVVQRAVHVCQRAWPDEGLRLRCGLLEIHSRPWFSGFGVFQLFAQTAPCPSPDVQGGLRPLWRCRAPAKGQGSVSSGLSHSLSPAELIMSSASYIPSTILSYSTVSFSAHTGSDSYIQCCVYSFRSCCPVWR